MTETNVAVVGDTQIASDEIPQITFVRPMPGFEELHTFALVNLDEGAEAPVVYELRSLQQPEVRFLVAVPGAFFSGYEVAIDDEACAELGLTEAADALVLTVLSTSGDDGQLTANLLAPVVINGRTRSAAQIILSGTDWPVRVALG